MKTFLALTAAIIGAVILPAAVFAGPTENITGCATEAVEGANYTVRVDPNCALLMWVVDSHFEESLQLGRAWGFVPKSIAFVWLKRDPLDARQVTMLRPIAEPAKIGMGYSTRKQAELCLLFTRGKPKRLSKGVRQVIEAPRREHSRKPDEKFQRVEALYAGPYLELFARAQRPGWTAWGNQTDKFGRVA